MLCKAFSVSTWSCANADKCPLVMSSESASVGSKDYKFKFKENGKNMWVWTLDDVSLSDLGRPPGCTSNQISLWTMVLASND